MLTLTGRETGTEQNLDQLLLRTPISQPTEGKRNAQETLKAVVGYKPKTSDTARDELRHTGANLQVGFAENQPLARRYPKHLELKFMVLSSS